MSKNVSSVPSNEADHLHRVVIRLEGIRTRAGAETALRGMLNLSEGESLAKIEGAEEEGSYAMYPEICCWRHEGRMVWGVNLFGYCEYRGEGCPA